MPRLEHSSRTPRILVYLMLLQFGVGGALYPFITLYLEDREISRSEISMIFLAAAGASAVLPFLWGWVADRLLPVNRLIALLHLTAATTLLCLGQLEAYAAIFVAFTLFSGFQHPTISLVNALCYHNLDDPEHQFGKLRLWGSVGWVLPSVPVYLWMLHTGDTEFGFVIYLTAGLQLVLVLSSPLLPHTPPPGKVTAAPRGVAVDEMPLRPPSSYRQDVRRLFGTPSFVVLLLSIFFVLSSFAIMFYWSSPRLREAGVPERWIGLVHAPGIVLEIPLFLLLPRVLKRIGYRGTLLLGGLAAVARHLVYALSNNQLVLIVGSMLIAPCVVFFLITASLAVNALAPREVRATAQCLQTLAGAGLGSMSGLLVASWLTSTAGANVEGSLEPPFLCAALGSLAGAMLLAVVRIETRDE